MNVLISFSTARISTCVIRLTFHVCTTHIRIYSYYEWPWKNIYICARKRGEKIHSYHYQLRLRPFPLVAKKKIMPGWWVEHHKNTNHLNWINVKREESNNAHFQRRSEWVIMPRGIILFYMTVAQASDRVGITLKKIVCIRKPVSDMRVNIIAYTNTDIYMYVLCEE